MYCVTLTTPTPQRVSSALRRANVVFQIVRTREARTLKGAQNPEVAQQIYDMAERGLVYPAIADQCQVSYHTVLRVVHNPEKYGVRGPPIHRQK